MKGSPKFYRWFALLLILGLALPQAQGFAAPLPATGQPHGISSLAPQAGGGVDPDAPDARGEWFYAWREAGDPNTAFSLAQAAELRAQAAQQIITAKTRPAYSHRPPAPTAAPGTPSALIPPCRSPAPITPRLLSLAG